MLQKIKNFFVGKKKFQKCFQKLHKISLLGMNYGMGGETHSSGELFFLKFFLNKIYKGQDIIIFDVGSNSGDYAMEIMNSINLNFEAHCFEPGEFAYDILTKRVVNKNFKLNKIAVSDFSGNSKLYYDLEGTTMASMSKIDYIQYNVKFDKIQDIKTTTIDDYCLSNRINRIHFLKIDIEGHELACIKGAKKLIESKNLDIIQFEFGLSNPNSRTFLRDFFIELSDYKIYRMLQDGLIEIKYHEISEIYLITNYIAVNKSIDLKYFT